MTRIGFVHLVVVPDAPRQFLDGFIHEGDDDVCIGGYLADAGECAQLEDGSLGLGFDVHVEGDVGIVGVADLRLNGHTTGEEGE